MRLSGVVLHSSALIRRVPISMIRSTYTTRNAAVTTTKKSAAMIGVSVITNETHPWLRRGFLSFKCQRDINDGRYAAKSESRVSIEAHQRSVHRPSRIIRCHITNPLSKVHWDAGTTTSSRFPFPKQPKSFPMPPNQRVRFHDAQSRPSIEKRHPLRKHKAIERRGFCFRSTYIASCLRRNRFSAAKLET